MLRAFPGERSSRLVAIGDGITESMERFMVVKTAAGVGMAVSAAVIMYGFGLDHSYCCAYFCCDIQSLGSGLDLDWNHYHDHS